MQAQKPSSAPSPGSLPKAPRQTPKLIRYWHVFLYYLFIVWEKSIIIILAVFSLMELFKASQFLISDYQVLQLHFSNQITNTEEVTKVLNEAIGVMLGTIINIIMAVRLSLAQERVSRIIELLLASALIIWNQQIISFLQSLDYTLLSQSVRF